jgi:hypothetical protein
MRKRNRDFLQERYVNPRPQLAQVSEITELIYYNQTLDEVASALLTQPELNVEIQGHTDSTGSGCIQPESVAQVRGGGEGLFD